MRLRFALSGLVACAALVLPGGCRIVPPPGACENDAACDDGLFCNGEERCVAGSCRSGSAPCDTDETCDEADNRCEPPQIGTPTPSCRFDSDCDNGSFCDGRETCRDGECVAGTNPCDDGIACNGVETCSPAAGLVDHVCRPGESPCADGRVCDGERDECVEP